jgi:hypothetical protein
MKLNNVMEIDAKNITNAYVNFSNSYFFFIEENFVSNEKKF